MIFKYTFINCLYSDFLYAQGQVYFYFQYVCACLHVKKCQCIKCMYISESRGDPLLFIYFRAQPLLYPQHNFKNMLLRMKQHNFMLL